MTPTMLFVYTLCARAHRLWNGVQVMMLLKLYPWLCLVAISTAAQWQRIARCPSSLPRLLEHALVTHTL